MVVEEAAAEELHEKERWINKRKEINAYAVLLLRLQILLHLQRKVSIFEIDYSVVSVIDHPVAFVSTIKIYHLNNSIFPTFFNPSTC